MNSTQITALVIILVYMAVTVAIGLFASRKKTEEKQSNDDFLMASKSLGPVVLAGTLFAANTGGASTTGIATNVFQYGLSMWLGNYRSRGCAIWKEVYWNRCERRLLGDI